MFRHVTSRLALSLVLTSAAMASAAWACGGGGGGYYGASYYHHGYHGQGFAGYDLVANRAQRPYIYGSYPMESVAMETSYGLWYARGPDCNGSGSYYYPSAGASGCGY